MNERNRMPMLVLAAASFALIGAGCGDQTSTSSTQTPPSVAQKMGSTADKMASATDKATVNAAAAIDDATITTKVKAAVMAEPGLKTLNIDVDTKDAVVTLNGTVDSPVLKQRAMQLAQNIGGVRQVVDNLVVKAS
jgi:osmotically-inducible protein OsmY